MRAALLGGVLAVGFAGIAAAMLSGHPRPDEAFPRPMPVASTVPIPATPPPWLGPTPAEEKAMKADAAETAKQFPVMVAPPPPDPHSVGWYNAHPAQRSAMVTACSKVDADPKPHICQTLMAEDAARLQEGPPDASWMGRDAAYLRANNFMRNCELAECKDSSFAAQNTAECAAAQSATHAYPP